jgi:pristinamycin I synthase 3 and 4
VTTSIETFPLSYAQQRLWFLQRMEGPNAVFNLPIALRITGALNTSALLTALRDIVARHESLRTVLRDSEDETPYQHIFAPETHELRIATADITEEQLPALCAEFASTPVDITKELPFRAWLYRLDDEHHVLFLLLHHIAGDGWSLGVLKRDLGEAYTARRNGHAPGFRELEIQYADYTLWQKEMLGDENQPTSILARQLEFWRRALSGMPEELALPTDRPRPASASFRGGLVTLKLNATLHRALAAFSQETGASLFMVLQAALAALLSRLGAGEDIPLGMPVAGRDEEALEELIGFFVNTLVLRTDVSGDPSFRELVARVRDFNFRSICEPGCTVRHGGPCAAARALSRTSASVPGHAGAPELTRRRDMAGRPGGNIGAPSLARSQVRPHLESRRKIRTGKRACRHRRILRIQLRPL